MKKEIHPDYHDITIIMTDGTSFQTRSTYGKAGASIQLDVDITTHPAWSGGKGALKKTGAMDKFAAKFGNMDFSTKKAAS
jgi:large subunit ribosomal protein L31